MNCPKCRKKASKRHCNNAFCTWYLCACVVRLVFDSRNHFFIEKSS